MSALAQATVDEDEDIAVRTARQQSERRTALEQELADLTRRMQVAKRRLAAHDAEIRGDHSVWLGTPSQIVAMRKQLRDACDDHKVLMRIVEDVRKTRQTLTHQALQHYAHLHDGSLHNDDS